MSKDMGVLKQRKVFLAFLLLCLFILNNKSHAYSCKILIKPTYLENPFIKVVKSPSKFFVEDSANKFGELNEPFFFNASFENDQLSIDSILRDGSNRSSLSGGRLFSDAIKHFGQNKIHTIQGNWFNYSDNFATFYQVLNMGLPPSDAAMMTWTGQQAMRHGYIYASVTVVKDKSGAEHYDYIQVVFSKDSKDKSDELKTVFE